MTKRLEIAIQRRRGRRCVAGKKRRERGKKKGGREGGCLAGDGEEMRKCVCGRRAPGTVFVEEGKERMFGEALAHARLWGNSGQWQRREYKQNDHKLTGGI